MKNQLKAVEEFHRKFGHPVANTPSNTDIKTCELRERLMREENEEYLAACKEGNIVEIADALGDQLYILCGTMLVHGMQDKIVDVFNEIQASNMSKLGEDGEPILREDGKILKGPNYFKPNIQKILDVPADFSIERKNWCRIFHFDKYDVLVERAYDDEDEKEMIHFRIKTDWGELKMSPGYTSKEEADENFKSLSRFTVKSVLESMTKMAFDDGEAEEE